MKAKEKALLKKLIENDQYNDVLSFIEESIASEPEAQRVDSPEEVYTLIKRYSKATKEKLIVITLNTARAVINIHVVSVGLVNRTIAHPREIFRPALIDNASAIILAHNHPSGELTPSDDDVSLTKRIKEAGDVLGIQLLDHVVISRKGFRSFAQSPTIGGNPFFN